MDDTKIKMKEVLDQELTRREFLHKSVLAVLLLIGLPAIIALFTSNLKNKGNLPGYGMRDYGP